jgi:hypothetical protein
LLAAEGAFVGEGMLERFASGCDGCRSQAGTNTNETTVNPAASRLNFLMSDAVLSNFQ